MEEFVIKDGVLVSYKGKDVVVDIPEGVERIGYGAFRYNPHVQTVTVPKGVKSIGGTAFYGCEKLWEVILPDGLEVIEEEAFSKSALEHMEVPESVSMIRARAFKECKQLRVVRLPKQLRNIESETFMDCERLREVEMPEELRSIGTKAFTRCFTLKSVYLSHTLTSIGEDAFLWCDELREIHIPHGVTEIPRGAFYWGKSLERVHLPNGLKKIGRHAFFGCISLREICIPDSVEEIEQQAFMNCSKLERLHLPSGIYKVAKSVFQHCHSLREADIPQGVLVIEQRAFGGCTAMERLRLPEGLLQIEEEAFGSCRSLRSLRIPAGLKDLGAKAFNDCSGLERLEFTPSQSWRITAKLFADILPRDVAHSADTLAGIMDDGALRQYIICGGKWAELSVSVQADIFIAKQAKPVQKEYAAHIPEECLLPLAQELLRRLEGKATAKQCNAVAMFMTLFPAKVPAAVLHTMLDALRGQKNGAKALKTVAEHSVLQCFLGNDAIDESLPQAEQLVLRWLMGNQLSVENLEEELKRCCGMGFANLPVLRDNSGEALQRYVTAYLLMVHKPMRGGAVKGYDGVGVCADAAKLLALLDEASVQGALSELADHALLPERGERLQNMVYPICRYAHEPLMQVLTARAPKWRSMNSGINAPLLRKFRRANANSNTRAAMLFADRYQELDAYAALRNTDADTLRDGYLSDVGLDAEGCKRYDLGNQTVTAVLQKDLSFAVADKDGRVTKSLPKKGADRALYEAAEADFADMKKAVKKIVKNRKDRLFDDFLSGRARAAEQWKASYLNNPLLRMVASLLVWEQGDDTFILTEHGAVCSNGSDYAFADAPIRLAHPMEMPEETVRAWQSYFVTHDLKQPFAQIWEPVRDRKKVFYDRYKGCKIPFYCFRGQEKHGIFVRDEEFHDDITITFADCVAEVERVDWGYHEILNEHRFEVKDFGFAAYTRRVNHVVAYLDKVTIYDRILQNDVSIIDLLDGFTSAQIAEFTDFASKNDRTECTALLMQYQNSHHGDFDPMAEFLLEL